MCPHQRFPDRSQHATVARECPQARVPFLRGDIAQARRQSDRRFDLLFGEGDFFDAQFAGLLREIGADISFSLDSLYKERERKRAQRALHAETMERLRLSEELREKEKILILKSRQAAMGETIEYIAHQWKQPLNALAIYAQLMKRAFRDGACTGEYLERMTGNIMEQVEAMTRTIGEHREFHQAGGGGEAIRFARSLRRDFALIGDSTRGSAESPSKRSSARTRRLSDPETSFRKFWSISSITPRTLSLNGIFPPRRWTSDCSATGAIR